MSCLYLYISAMIIVYVFCMINLLLIQTKTCNHRRSFVLVSPTFCVDLIFVMFGNLQEHNQLWQEYVQFKDLFLIWFCLCRWLLTFPAKKKRGRNDGAWNPWETWLLVSGPWDEVDECVIHESGKLFASALRILGPSDGRVWTCIAGVRVLKIAIFEMSGLLGWPK